MSFVFIIIQHVTNETSNLYWQECCCSIRKWYPSNKIVIIDDHSSFTFQMKFDLDFDLDNIIFIDSEVTKGCGEFLGYYYYYKHKWADHAIILHDSFWIQNRIPGLDSFLELGSDSNIKFLCHFNTRYNHHSFQEEMNIIQQLKNPKDLISFFHQIDVCNVGCFGIQSCISYSFLERLEERFEIMNLINVVHDREKRMCLERVFGAMTLFMCPKLKKDSSFYGDILIDYVDKYEHTSFGYYLENKEKMRLEDRPFIKVFSGR